MFENWFKTPNYSNVVKFPEVPKMPYVTPPKVEEQAQVFYRLGVTDNTRVSLQVGYSELTMSKLGVENLIQQLQVFRDQLTDERDE
jgi:hypothetical protein